MSLQSRPFRKLALAGATATIALAGVAAPAGAASSKTLNYQCKYPLIGTKTLSIKIDLDIPTTWPTSVATNPFNVVATASAYDVAAGLGSIDGLTALQGTATASATVLTAQGYSVPAKTVATIATTTLPDPVPNPLVLTATGQTPALTFDDPGVETITLDKLAINLTALDASGAAIALPPVSKDIDGNAVSDSDGDANTFDVYCKLIDGQDTTLGTFEIVDDGSTGTTTTPTATPTATPTTATVTPTATATATPTPTATSSTNTGATANFSYNLTGSTTVNTLTKGSMPLTGTIDAALNVSTGAYTATTVLNNTSGRLTALGILPVTVGIGMVPSGATTGTLVDDYLTANLKLRIKVTSVKAFGIIPLAGGNSCQSKQLSDIALASTDSFDPTGTGG
ncbi:MAG: hypothetical protein QM679_10135, partial [Patulibacter sp.]